MPYSFSLIRFVPDPGRGEFVNIAALAGDDDSGDWALRAISNYQRARAIDTKTAFPAAIAFVAELDEKLADLELLDDPQVSVPALEALARDMQNIVQVTWPAPIVADTAEGALDVIFDRLVVDPAKRTYRFHKKTRAQAATRHSYVDEGIPSHAVSERARVTAGEFDAAFDFAVHNGRALQLVQCWSFQLPHQDELAQQIRSWSWMVYELRSHGAQLHAQAGDLDVPTDLEIAAVSVQPADGQDSPAFREATAAFKEIDVELVDADDARVVASRAAELLGRTPVT